MKNRYADALLSQSACNPIALTNSLVKWQADLLAEGKGTDEIKNDVACKLLVYQLAFLFGVAEAFTDYSAVYAECERLAAEARP